MHQHQKLSPLMFAGGLDADAFFGATLQHIHEKKERKKKGQGTVSLLVINVLFQKFLGKALLRPGMYSGAFSPQYFFSAACEIIGTISQLFLQQTLVSTFHF